MPKSSSRLTAKQDRFVAEYLSSRNGTQAAIKAGYSPKTARAIACETLKKPAVAAEIEKRQGAQRQQSEATAALLLDELSKIAFANLGDVFDGKGNIKPPSQWPAELRRAVHFKFDERYAKGRDGRARLVKSIKTVSMPHKIKAISLLMKLLGICPPGSERARGRPQK